MTDLYFFFVSFGTMYSGEIRDKNMNLLTPIYLKEISDTKIDISNESCESINLKLVAGIIQRLYTNTIFKYVSKPEDIKIHFRSSFNPIQILTYDRPPQNEYERYIIDMYKKYSIDFSTDGDNYLKPLFKMTYEEHARKISNHAKTIVSDPFSDDGQDI